MKTNSGNLYLNPRKSIGWLCLFFLLGTFLNTAIAQRDGGKEGSGTRYEGVQVTNGMMDFQSQDAFNRLYDNLEAQIKNDREESTRDDANNEEETIDDNPVLAEFEASFPGYRSLRLQELQREEAFLAKGGDPERFEETDLVIDEVIASFINTNRSMKVGKSIYYLPFENSGFEITDGDMRTYEALLRGESPLKFSNIKIVGGPNEEDCVASFGINGNTNGLNYSFTFTGKPTALSHPEATINYHWTFGDGNTSSSQNPSHGYAEAGTYQVCVRVEMRTKDGEYCSASTCQSITIEEEEPQDTTVSCHGAALFLWNETGEPGEVCFTPIGGAIYNIVSYSWTFGDGNTSNAQNACNTYECDLSPVWVSLTVVLDNGCQVTYTLPVSITSNNCCERNAKSSGTEHYANQKKFKWEQKSKHFLWWFNRVYVKMRCYKKPGWRWKRDKKSNIRVETYGNVYTEDAAGCGCENDYDVTAHEVEYNDWKVVLKKKITKKYKTRKGWEWGAKYFVEGSLKKDQLTGVACD